MLMARLLPWLVSAALLPAGKEPVAWWRFDEGQGTTVRDVSGRFAGTMRGARWTEGRFGKALFFDGNAEVVIPSAPDLQLTGPISVEAWIRPERISGYHMIVRKENEYQLRLNAPREGRFATFFVFLDGKWEPRVQGAVPEVGKWHHLVGIWTGETLQIWLDGRPTFRDRLGHPKPTDNPVRIGSGFVGAIDEVRVYRRALGLGEVWEHCTGRPLPETEAREPRFAFAHDAEGWFAAEGLDEVAAHDGTLTMRVTSPTPLLVSPPLKGQAEELDFLSLRLKVDRGVRGEVWVETKKGVGVLPFALHPDGRWHTYNVETVSASVWEGRVRRLALRPSDVPGARVALDELSLAPEPAGKPDLVVSRFDLRDTLPRAGRTVEAVAVVRNLGGPARNVRLGFHLPEGVRLVSGQRKTVLPALEFAEDRMLFWRVEAKTPMTARVVLTVVAEGSPSVKEERAWVFPPSLHLPRHDYVPEPRPVRGPFEIGVKYFPGWPSLSRWARIMPYVERTPALGWYREGSPEVMDWHIKWAVEHGVTFFLFDWYWVRGYRFLEHALHEGLFHARYRNLIRFAIHWANHNPPGTSSEEDTLALARFWLEHYFRRPNYLRIEGKPAVFIFAPDNLTRDLGGPEAVRRVWEKVRALCREEDVGGLYLVARGVGNEGELRRRAQEGYDAVWLSANLRAGVESGVRAAPMETVWAEHPQIWRRIRARGLLPVFPMPWSGWDSRPWHGTRAYVLTDAAPEGFRRHLEVVRSFLRNSPGPKLAVVWAWNEWGEGSYVEPCRGSGFGYLDAIRAVFTEASEEHTDLVPADVGLGPYEFRPVPYRTAWEFEQEAEGWDGGMGVRDLRVENGRLCFTTASRDPAIFGPPVRALAKRYPFVEVRLKTTADDTAQLYWITSTIPESEATVYRFPVKGDGQFHTYRLPVHQVRTWRGVITRLRLDPANRPEVQVEVDFIRLARSSP